MKVKINLSDKQQQRLRNGHSVRVTPKMAGSGASVIIDPMTFNNLNKHLERNKGMFVSLSPELIKENMSGGSLMGGLKSGAKMAKKGYDKLPTHTKNDTRKETKESAKAAVHSAVDAGFSAAASNPYTATAGVMGKVAYDEANVDRFIDKKNNKAANKSGLGLYASQKGNGLYAQKRGERLSLVLVYTLVLVYILARVYILVRSIYWCWYPT